MERPKGKKLQKVLDEVEENVREALEEAFPELVRLRERFQKGQQFSNVGRALSRYDHCAEGDCRGYGLFFGLVTGGGPAKTDTEKGMRNKLVEVFRALGVTEEDVEVSGYHTFAHEHVSCCFLRDLNSILLSKKLNICAKTGGRWLVDTLHNLVALDEASQLAEEEIFGK